MSFPHADRSLFAWHDHITQDVQLVCGDGGGVCRIWLHRNELFYISRCARVLFFSLFSLSTVLFYPVLVCEF